MVMEISMIVFSQQKRRFETYSNQFQNVSFTTQIETVSFSPQTETVSFSPEIETVSFSPQIETVSRDWATSRENAGQRLTQQQKAKNNSNRLEDCVYCGKTFPHKLLIKHKAEEEKSLRCQYCDKDFENVYLYRRHAYRYHKYYSCKTCNLRFLKGAYEYHMSSVHRGKQECKVCNKTFATKLSLVAHQKKIHLGQRDERFQCQICKYKAPDKFQYKVHLARHNKAPSLVCDYCGAGHYTKTELKKHIQADHCGGYLCDVCSRSFRSPEYLKRHKATHEPDYDPSRVNFTCEECGKGFLTEARFKRHSLRHKGALPTYRCNLCGKTVTSKASLETHMRMHRGAKPFECAECGKTFSDRKYLTEHKRHHVTNRTFGCSACGEKFEMYGLLVAHKKIHFQ